LNAVLDDAVERVHGGDGRCPVLITCEHASNFLPPPWAWPAEDARLVDTHWAWDLGVAELVRLLAGGLEATAVLARASRLLIDVNRPLDSDTLLRAVADGEPVRLNTAVHEQDRVARIEQYYAPYHRAIDEEVERVSPRLILSLHSFTPVYEGGAPREVQIGVLWDVDEALGRQWAEILRRSRFTIAEQEPYSGKGFMYSAQHHATNAGIPAIELEIRNDLLLDEAIVPEIAALIAGALAETGALGDLEAE
jgi:predicted N-formylglutamate amidohydrolase